MYARLYPIPSRRRQWGSEAPNPYSSLSELDYRGLHIPAQEVRRSGEHGTFGQVQRLNHRARSRQSSHLGQIDQSVDGRGSGTGRYPGTIVLSELSLCGVFSHQSLLRQKSYEAFGRIYFGEAPHFWEQVS
jgi:hypothetical protein